MLPLKPSPALQVFVETWFLMYGLMLAGMDGAGMLFIFAKYLPMARGIMYPNTSLNPPHLPPSVSFSTLLRSGLCPGCAAKLFQARSPR